MSRKVIIELEDNIYDELAKIYQETKKINSELKFEDFISEVVSKYVTVKNKTNELFAKSFKSMFENIDPTQLDNLFSSMKNMGDIFGDSFNDSTKNNNDKKTEQKDEQKVDENQPRKKS